MLTVRTRVGPSGIHGLGVLAAEPVAAGAVIWSYHPLLDLSVGPAEREALPGPARAFLAAYGYIPADGSDAIIVCADDARFMNHSETPNTDFSGEAGIAIRDIPEGAEITCDYRQFCAAHWLANYPFIAPKT